MKWVKLGPLVEKVHVRAESLPNYNAIPVFGVSNKEGICVTSHVASEDLAQYLLIEEGCFAYNPYRINVGSIGLTPEGTRGLVSPAYVVFKVKKGVLLPSLLLDYLKSSDGLAQINMNARGTVRKALRFEDLCEIEINLISYEDQVRAENRKYSIQKYLNPLITEITHQQDLLKKLRQQILQDAISGKLTAEWRKMNPHVEPASELLKRIQAEKVNWLIREISNGNQEARNIERKLQKKKCVSAYSTPYDLPPNWIWVSIFDVSNLIVDCHNKTAPYKPSGIKLIRTTNIKNGALNFTDVKYVDAKTYEFWSRRCKPLSGDILFTREAPAGEAAIIPEGETICLGQRTMLIRPFDKLFPRKFLLFSLLNQDFISRLLKTQKGAIVKHLRVGDVENALIALPPREEITEIVKLIESLSKTIDDLELSIHDSSDTGTCLLRSILKEAFEA